jgi:multidrug efflux pump subunit AcrB
MPSSVLGEPPMPDGSPLAVNHQGQLPSVTLSFNLVPGASIGAAVAAIQQAKKELHPPPSSAASSQGSPAFTFSYPTLLG